MERKKFVKDEIMGIESKSVTKEQMFFSKIKLNDELWLREKYECSKMSIKNISKLLGFCSKTVSNKLKIFEIKIKNFKKGV